MEFPLAIDSTMRSAFVACPRRFFWEYLLHQKPLEPSVHLHAGGAFAYGMEVARREFYGNGRSEQEAIGLGAIALTKRYGDFTPSSPYVGKTWDGMLGAFDAYFHAFPLSSDPIRPVMKTNGEPCVEFSFAIPIPGTRHPDNGDPVLYMGRFDMLGQMDKAVYVVDEKTTSQLGASWSKQWDLRGQLTGYAWAAREFGYDCKGAIIRGVSILKTGYGTAQAITYRPQWKIDDWLASLRSDVERMIRIHASGTVHKHWPQALDSACASYGGCPFIPLCDSPDPTSWLSSYYETRVWSPLRMEEQPIKPANAA